MSDYKFLEDVVGMKKLSQDIERIDLKKKRLAHGVDDLKIEKYELQRDELFQAQICRVFRILDKS